MMPPPVTAARALGRRRALQAAALGGLLTYAAAAAAFAPAGQRLRLLWPGRTEFGPSLAVAGFVLLGGAALAGTWAGPAIGRRPGRAAGIGAVGGIGVLLLAALAGSGWNFAQHAIRFAPFPGTTAADYQQHLRDCLADYVGKPLAYVLPLGSVGAGLLGAWAGRGVRAGLARRAA
ncbi:hypothetical protein EJV47_24885 [Hymenobacter gummosus]|uniref:Uncharacterized protein n=1 Tax=Hymenobacter gummosus TaxID=1776032 RepID=A0A3S0H5T0_9BACT|nr:hypothetical protein [Hymenobacter gummosus]RTQ45725.1 hypothetical protein EJV47_24885 [Hymenobacter gummosus]